ncbi:MAG TPA: TAT-variant-translocated molybdopterin oxidoreductase [Terriglobales bacterium]|nr:TAT-variant-translocated molybdopterin oxidoreductase [Terriglobales bacterium]
MAEPTTKRYWKSPEERDADPQFLEAAAVEFSGLETANRKQLPRRDFLRASGFALAAAMTGCSRAPVEKAIPMLVQPEELVPGRSLLYASTCGACSAGCGVLVKVRDGRSIKLEGNPQHPLSRGGLCAVGQASLLGLYDSQRLMQPMKNGKAGTWEEVDREVTARLNELRKSGGAIRFLSGTITSPTLRAALSEFLGGFKDANHVIYDAISHAAILDAHEQTHGVRLLPRYRFDRAEVIAAFDADFLGTWISPVEFTAGYRAGRKLEADPPRMSYHTQFEPRMSLTGAKADRRFAVMAGELGVVLAQLAERIAAKAGTALKLAPATSTPVPAAYLDELAARLWNARGRSLVVCGSQEVGEQVLVNAINQMLDNYGATLELDRPSFQAQGDDRNLQKLIAELESGTVQALLLHGVNPLFDLPQAAKLEAELRRVPLVISFAERVDETAALAHYVCPEPHFLESWSDAEPVSGLIAVTQPAMQRLGATRQLLETLAAWSGKPQSALQLMQESWRKNVYPRGQSKQPFQAFWDQAVHDGVIEVEYQTVASTSFRTEAVTAPAFASAPAPDELELVLYPKVGMQDGRHAYNPWLHELPDPITKVAWDNYACVSPALARRLGIAEGDVVRVTSRDGLALELPAYVQPGQHDRVVAIALGYGSRLSARFANIGPAWMDALPSVNEDGVVGKNAAPLADLRGTLRYHRPVKLTTINGRRDALASTQTHHTLTVPERLAPLNGKRRPLVQETTLAAWRADPHSGVHEHETKEELWPADHAYAGHRWGMVIDLSACTGCSACVLACQAENNIPVVGKDEMRRNREMHWMRIDRYYAENAAGDVDVAFQPLFCQHCGNAPCETVCPVLATVHSSEGLNEQVYNRCIGTRYCANNCPYKGRRFNWFNYARDDRLQNLVLNPDVTVRSRGVMEKCTFCVQRIQEAKLQARTEGRSVEDGELQTACQQSCPAQAVFFGDLNDPHSQVSRMMSNPRRYRLLAELNVAPSVGYLSIVRNREEEPEKEHHG